MFQLTSTIIILDHFPIQKAAQRCPCRTSSPPGCAKDCVTSSWESVGCSDNSHLGVLEMVVTINRWFLYIYIYVDDLYRWFNRWFFHVCDGIFNGKIIYKWRLLAGKIIYKWRFLAGKIIYKRRFLAGNIIYKWGFNGNIMSELISYNGIWYKCT